MYCTYRHQMSWPIPPWCISSQILELAVQYQRYFDNLPYIMALHFRPCLPLLQNTGQVLRENPSQFRVLRTRCEHFDWWTDVFKGVAISKMMGQFMLWLRWLLSRYLCNRPADCFFFATADSIRNGLKTHLLRRCILKVCGAWLGIEGACEVCTSRVLFWKRSFIGMWTTCPVHRC